MSEAKGLALVLQTGALPVRFDQIARTDVSATLGKSSLQEAWKAAAVGLAIVALFLLLLYRFLGLVAVIGLGIYAALLYAALLLFHVTGRRAIQHHSSSGLASPGALPSLRPGPSRPAVDRYPELTLALATLGR